MKKVLQQKLYLSKEQENSLDSILFLCREFYNYLISIDKKHKELFDKYLTKTELFRQCAIIKHSDSKYSTVHSHLLQDVAKRLYLARQSAWKRAKENKIPFKYPRIKIDLELFGLKNLIMVAKYFQIILFLLTLLF